MKIKKHFYSAMILFFSSAALLLKTLGLQRLSK